MDSQDKEYPEEKSRLHPRSKHRKRYDFKQLVDSCPELSRFVRLNHFNDESIDFSEQEAVKTLNKALLKCYYDIENWDIPANYLCPPVPGRAEYIHRIADLLGDNNHGEIPTGNQIRCLDIGVGANCVYPIIGNKEYGWSFTGADIDPVAIESCNKIVASNPLLKGKIELRLQANPENTFRGIIQKDENFDLTLCNPPFHASSIEAQAGTMRKLRNIHSGKITQPILNFGGQNSELWCDGGEEKFVHDMIFQSVLFKTSCFWFSTLVSKQSNLKGIYTNLKKAEAVNVKTLPINHGNKQSRIVAWTFLSDGQQKKWIRSRWNNL